MSIYSVMHCYKTIDTIFFSPFRLNRCSISLDNFQQFIHKYGKSLSDNSTRNNFILGQRQHNSKVKRKRIRLLDDLSCARGTFSLFDCFTDAANDRSSKHPNRRWIEWNKHTMPALISWIVRQIYNRKVQFVWSTGVINKKWSNAPFFADENTVCKGVVFGISFIIKISMRPCDLCWNIVNSLVQRIWWRIVKFQ